MILTCSDLDSLSSPQDLLDCRHGLDCRRPPPCLYDQEREPHGSPSIWPASAAGHPGRLPGHGTELLPPTAPPHHRCVGRSRCTCRVSYRGTERGKSGTPSSNVGSKFFVAHVHCCDHQCVQILSYNNCVQESFIFLLVTVACFNCHW